MYVVITWAGLILVDNWVTHSFDAYNKNWIMVNNYEISVTMEIMSILLKVKKKLN